MIGKIPVGGARLRRRTATMVAVAVTAIGLVAVAPAVAAESLWVAQGPTVSGNGKGCAKPGYNAIQAAINKASSGATIHVCGGTYEEQLQLTKAVSLKAAEPSATVKLPAAPADSTTSCGVALSATTQAVIDICGSASVQITGLTVEGDWPPATCNDDLYDILVGGGANLKLRKSNVLGAGDSPIKGCQGGIGIQIGSNRASQLATATLSSDTVAGYQKNGIDVDGPGSVATIKGTTVKGAGTTNVIAQNGIQVSRGGVAKISKSTVTEDKYEGAYAASGIIFYEAGSGSKITGSTISNDDLGIDYEESGTSQLSVTGSTFENNRYTSLYILEGSVTVKKSTMNGGEDGIDLLQFAGQTSGPAGTATDDTIENMSSYAVVGFSDNEPSDPGGTFRIVNSKISNNPPGASVAQSVFSESPTLIILTEKDS